MYFPNYFQFCYFYQGFSSTMCQFWKYILLDCLHSDFQIHLPSLVQGVVFTWGVAILWGFFIVQCFAFCGTLSLLGKLSDFLLSNLSWPMSPNAGFSFFLLDCILQVKDYLLICLHKYHLLDLLVQFICFLIYAFVLLDISMLLFKFPWRDRADVLRGYSRVLEHLLPFASAQRCSHKSHFLGQQLLTSSHLRAAQDPGWCLGPGGAHCPAPTLLHLAWLLLSRQGVRPGPGTGICPESAGAHLSAKASDSLPHWSY